MAKATVIEQNPSMRIGLFGGSFNPIHNAHIILASTICQQANLDEVWFMVSPQNPFKKVNGLLDEKDRFEMVKLGLEDFNNNQEKFLESNFLVIVGNFCSLQRSANDAKFEHSNIRDKEEDFGNSKIRDKRENGIRDKKVSLKASDYEFHLDRPSYTWKTLESLHRDFPDHEFSLIIGGDNWVAFPRWAHHEEILSNHDIYIYPREDSQIDESTLPSHAHLVHTPKINITSTMLRQMINEGKDITPYVPKSVAEIIKERNFYL